MSFSFDFGTPDPNAPPPDATQPAAAPAPSPPPPAAKEAPAKKAAPVSPFNPNDTLVKPAGGTAAAAPVSPFNPDDKLVTPVGTGEDIARGAGGGLIAGTTGLVSGPLAAGSWLQKHAIVPAAKAVGLETDPDPGGMLARGAANVQQAGEQATKGTYFDPTYQPTTTAGQFAKTGAEFVPGMLIPGGGEAGLRREGVEPGGGSGGRHRGRRPRRRSHASRSGHGPLDRRPGRRFDGRCPLPLGDARGGVCRRDARHLAAVGRDRRRSSQASPAWACRRCRSRALPLNLP